MTKDLKQIPNSKEKNLELVKKLYKQIEKNSNETLDKVSKQFNSFVKKQNQFMKNVEQYIGESIKIYKSIEYKIESFEVAMLTIMHNIKKNQFLYSHYPDDWVKSFNNHKEKIDIAMKNCIKESLKMENNYMDSELLKKTIA